LLKQTWKKGHEEHGQETGNTYEEAEDGAAELVVTVAPMENAGLVPITLLILLCNDGDEEDVCIEFSVYLLNLDSLNSILVTLGDISPRIGVTQQTVVPGGYSREGNGELL
jgi:hypothetical protein